jgi:uncharacterized protein (DUF305 family)
VSTRLGSAILLAVIHLVALDGWPQHSQPHGASAAAEHAWSELAASMATMHAAMASAESSGDSEIDFVTLMLPHHQAAVEMARTELLYGSDPQMRRLAQEIMTEQKLEIDLMRLWLLRRGTR